MNYRKTLMAAVLAVPLALTACGSDEENADNAAASSSTESSTSAKATDKPDADKDKDKKDDKESGEAKPSDENKPEGEQGDNPDRPAGAPAPNGQGNGQPAPAGGGNAADKEAITNLVNGMDDGGNNMQALAYYTLDNSCTAYINAKGGEAQLRSEAKQMVNPANGAPLTFTDFEKMARQAGMQVPNNMGMAKIQKVENINVNGDNATAFVTSDQNAAEMQFAREGGQWKICPAG